MDEKEMIEELKKVLGLGYSFQTIIATIGYAVRTDKVDFVKELGELLKKFQESLNEEEKKELKDDIDITVREKLSEVLDEMGKTMTEEEINSVLTELASEK